MFGVRTPLRSVVGDEAEKPFWISYSDLMTALMVLFLVAMSVALLSITQKAASGPAAHNKKIEACMSRVAAMTDQEEFHGINIQGHKISFGTRALFTLNSHKLGPAAEKTLRAYVPKVLELARAQDGCSKVFKRVIVEGFASQSGTYIHNLNLSLQRAERVLCVLLSTRSASDALTDKDRTDVRGLFLVAGSSFNDLQLDAALSQRIELKLEFLAYQEKKEEIRTGDLDEMLQCPLDQ